MGGWGLFTPFPLPKVWRRGRPDFKTTVGYTSRSQSGTMPASFHRFKRGRTRPAPERGGLSPLAPTSPSPQTKAGDRRGFADAQTDVPPGIPEGPMCVQRLDDSLNSAIHINYRVSLRSSSMREPRDPLLKVLSVIRLRSQTF
jgi:hypothetical protein